MGRYGRELPVSEMDSQRALLDTLMGHNRNNDSDEVEIKDCFDSRLCRCFLYGLCPTESLNNTKMSMGPCEKIHSEQWREVFEAEREKYDFDNEVEREYMSYVAEADRTIKVRTKDVNEFPALHCFDCVHYQRARGRLEEDKSDVALNTDTNADVLKIQGQISVLAAQVVG